MTRWTEVLGTRAPEAGLSRQPEPAVGSTASSLDDEPPDLSPFKQMAVLAMPGVLIPSMADAFRCLGRHLGPRRGYLAAFLMYWIGWCVLFPLWVLGPPGVRAAFAAPRMPMGRLHWKDYALIALPPLVGDIFAFPSAIREASPPVVAASAIIALVNAVGEELLWRGVFLRAFPRRLLLGQIYASLTFGLWHVAPQTVAPSRHPGGSASFAVFATAVGLIYGRIAARTGSIRASTLSHALLDFSGLGARVYFR